MSFGRRESAGAEAGRSDRHASPWERLRAGGSREAVASAWLGLLCERIPGVRGGLVLLGPPDRGPFTPAASWPHVLGEVASLKSAAERCLEERGALVTESAARRGRHQLALPVESGGSLCGAVVLEVSDLGEAELAAALAELRWASAWLEAAEGRLALQQGEAVRRRLQGVLELLASVPERDRYGASATHLATELATRLRCDRVAVGAVERGRARLVALSHSAEFGNRTNLVRALEAAMDECLDRAQTLVHPGEGALVAPAAHGELAREGGSAAICTVPLLHRGTVQGFVCLERSVDPFDREDVALCEAVAALVAPVLHLKQRDERSLAAVVGDRARELGKALFGPGQAGQKLAALGAVALVLFLALARGDYRVTARATLEPQEERAAVAPFDGYLLEAPVRAGAQVRAGETLARLDDRELQLERQRWTSELLQLSEQRRRARAEDDAAEVRILSAQIERARARLGLAEDRLARAEVQSPFDGIVVQGDLSRSLGAPVQRGDVLFEVAPLDAYRLALDVDERDVRALAADQSGRLVLEAAPDLRLGFRVTRVTPLSEVAEGRNSFRVEAELASSPARLRPGMEGVGKIDVGERSLVWIFTHRALDWLRLSLWRWWP